MPPAFDPDYLTRQSRALALRCSVAEILTGYISQSALVQPDKLDWRVLHKECDRMALDIAEGILGSLWPWGDTIDVEQARDDLRPMGPFRPCTPADDPF